MTLIRANSRTLTGVSLPADNMPSGSVLQVQQTKSSAAVSTNSTSFQDFLTVSITPSATTSKILVTANLYIGTRWWNNNPNFQIARDSTVISANSSDAWPYQFGADSSNNEYEMVSYHLELLDSPSTTSAITYKAQVKSQSTSYYVYMNRNYAQSSILRGESYITVMEIAG